MGSDRKNRLIMYNGDRDDLEKKRYYDEIPGKKMS
jgi:hypothetical protein